MAHRSRSIEIRPTQLIGGTSMKRSFSAPPSGRNFPISSCRSRQDVSRLGASPSKAPPPLPPSDYRDSELLRRTGRLGPPPSKAPPPLPPSDYRYSESMRRTRRSMTILYNCSGNVIMDLSVDFTHTVADVEKAVLYYKQLRVEFSEPKPTRSNELVLSLCKRAGVDEIKVIALPSDGVCKV